jgi:hypothetical protein
MIEFTTSIAPITMSTSDPMIDPSAGIATRYLVSSMMRRTKRTVSRLRPGRRPTSR